MRYVVLLATLVTFSATAEEPEMLYKFQCIGTNLVITLKVNAPGIYQLPGIPHNICGKDL